MKNLIKKNQLMITALAIMIAIAGYLQFAGTGLQDEYLKGENEDTSPVDSNGIINENYTADGLLDLFKTINENGQTILMVTHSVKAASTANRVLFIKDGEVFHQLYRGNLTNEQMYQKISDTLTVLTTGGDRVE